MIRKEFELKAAVFQKKGEIVIKDDIKKPKIKKDDCIFCSIEETAFIRGKFTFWKCSICNGWHEGEIHKCPIKKVFDDIDKIKFDRI